MKVRDDKMKFWDIFQSEGAYGSGFFGRCKKYFYGMPDALPWGEWKKWDAETKSKYPISWFFLDTVPDFVWGIGSPIRRWYPHFRSKYIRKDHHLVLDVERLTKLDGYEPDKPIYAYHWRDSDTQIQWALVQILINYVEKEKDIVDWNHDPDHKKIYDEFMEIYNYWVKERPAMIEKSHEETHVHRFTASMDDIFDKDDQNRTQEEKQKYRDWEEANKKHDKDMRDIHRLDSEMMIRIIMIRENLWS